MIRNEFHLIRDGKHLKYNNNSGSLQILHHDHGICQAFGGRSSDDIYEYDMVNNAWSTKY